MDYLIGHSVGLSGRYIDMNVPIQEDTMFALEFNETLPPQSTPLINHYVTKTIWLCKDIFKKVIKLVNIDTLQNLGGMFIKVSSKVT